MMGLFVCFVSFLLNNEGMKEKSSAAMSNPRSSRGFCAAQFRFWL